MDRLTLLENEIANAILSIDGTTQPSGYTYYSVSGQVDIDDDVLATSKNFSITDVNHTLTTNPSEEENIEWGLTQNIYTNTVIYELRSQIKLDGSQTNTKRSAKIKCNEVMSDIKEVLGKTHSLNRQCNWVKYNGYTPSFTTDGNLIKSAVMIGTIELNYSQSMSNPDNIAC